MDDSRPRIIFCQKEQSDGREFARKAELGGCAVIRTPSVRVALESAMTGLPSAIFVDTVVDDGTATMLFDLAEKLLPHPRPPIFVVAGPERELQLVQRRRFSGVILGSDGETFERILHQFARSPISPHASSKTRAGT